MANYNRRFPFGKELTRLIRQYKPDVVLTGNPEGWFFGSDYINHPDHRCRGAGCVRGGIPVSGNAAHFPGPVSGGTITDGQGHFAQADISVTQTDAAGDGIPDQWKLLYGLSLANDVSADDPDGDGLPNLAEYLLHTDPVVADNPLQINGISLPAVLSGTVILPLGISSDVDADAAGLAFYVDGDVADATIEKVNGQYVAEWYAGSVPNGLHQVSLGITYPTPTGDVVSMGDEQVVSVFNAVTSGATLAPIYGLSQH